MKRTAALTILFVLLLCWPTAPARANDPLTFFVAFSGNERLVVVSHRGGIKVLSVPDLKEIRSIAVEKGRRLGSAIVSRSGRWLAAGDEGGELRIWNLETGEAQHGVPLLHGYLVYVFSPGDDTLFVYQERLRVWDLKQGREAGAIEAVTDISHMTLSPDGRYLVAFGHCQWGRVYGDVCVYDLEEKKVVTAAEWEELFFGFRNASKPSNFYPSPVDLVHTEDGRILLTVGSSYPRAYQSRFVKPADLQVLETAVVEPERGWMYSGLRSAPTQQLEAVSPDRKWKATAYQKRLYLYRVTGERDRALQKYIPIPW